MHTLFKKFFHLDDTAHFPDDLETGFHHLVGVGYLKKKTASDSFIIKKCEDPLIIRLHNEAVESYQEFVTAFNSNFTNGYTHHKTFKLLRSKIDLVREEIGFQFINKNKIFVLYSNHFEFKGDNGQKEVVSICYRIPIDEREPLECTVKFDLIKVPCNYNYYSESALDFKYTGKYYPTNLLTIVFIANNFRKQIEEQFESIDKFVENFDDNIKILTMLVF